MTIRTKRRGRTLAAILAAMLMASVLSVVASGPAQAANTSGEELIDTNGDGVPDSREFAGTHRYDTAVKLAERFAADEGGISTAIIASGESQVDAVTAAGLAGTLDAPVLLTRSSRLPHNVARFIDEHNVTEVIIVGGSAAVSDAVQTEIEGLGSKPTVDRVSGDDRYGTAAAIGSKLGGPNPTWCNSTQPAAILVNGGDAGRADAIAIGPLAFSLGLPILLTSAEELPQSTADFLSDNKVERVVIVGGATAVPDAIRTALIEDVGVINASRISGGSAAATSVAIAKEMLGDCAAVLGTNRDMVALVNRDAIADGISSAPLLGRGLGNGGAVPILLVGDELPAAAGDFLANTPESRPGHGKTNMKVLAIGGTAVISEAVMEAATTAAESAPELTATITALTYTAVDAASGTKPDHKSVGDYKDIFRVSFSDDIDRASATDPTLYRVNNRRIEALADDAEQQGDEPELIIALEVVHVDSRTVQVTLSHDLEQDDTITACRGGGCVVGEKVDPDEDSPGDDMRELAETELTLGAPTVATDRSAPVVDILAVPGRTSFQVLVREANILHNEIADGELTEFVRVDSKDNDSPVKVTDVTPYRSGTHHYGYHRTYTVSVDTALSVGDVVRVERRAVLDRGGRGNALKLATVKAPRADGKFAISSVQIGDYAHTVQAFAEITGVGADGPQLRINAKATGDASGARGNDWVIYGYDDRAEDTMGTKAFDIEVELDMANSVMAYTIVDDKPLRDGDEPTLKDLAAALNANDDFAANFSTAFPTPQGDAAAARKAELEATDPTGVKFSGGATQVAVLVSFNDIVRQIDLNMIFDELDGPGADYVDVTGNIDARSTHFGDEFGISPDSEDKDMAEPITQVYMSYMAERMSVLPARSRFAVIPAGVALSWGDAKPDVEDDPDTEDVDEAEVTRGRQDLGTERLLINSLRPNSSITPYLPGTSAYVCAARDLFGDDDVRWTPEATGIDTCP